MSASDTLLARAEPWIKANARTAIRSLIPVPVLLFAWWIAQQGIAPTLWGGLAFYAFNNLALLFVVALFEREGREVSATTLLTFSAVIDIGAILWLPREVGPLHVVTIPLFLIIALKALGFRKESLWSLLLPVLFGPVMLAVAHSRGESDGFAYWPLIIGTCVMVVTTVLLAERRRLAAIGLRNTHAEREADLRTKLTEQEGVNNDLRVRIRRQQALEESMRAITNSLSIDDVYSQVLDSTTQMIGTQRVTAAALSLIEGENTTHRTVSMSTPIEDGWAEPLAERVLQQRAALEISDTMTEREWRTLFHRGICSVLSVPLIDVQGVIRGALTVVSVQRHAFTATDTRHLTSISIQASVAIHNAELHAQLEHQRLMLESVLRDITDGLVVINEAGSIVMANPVADMAFHHADGLSSPLNQRLIKLAEDVRHASEGLLSQEFRVPEQADEPERFYQAYASLVRLPDQEVANVAVVLRNITDQKARERQRIEFISMVSHELRNPLNTLNGFLKVVLQEKAGPLSPNQREFLTLADQQADQLKGRIMELLEFNRLESGRLRLQPQWANLTDLLLLVYARFQIAAEEAGLSLTHQLADNIPETLMDSERIGQVVTNLIENAMKATAAGGSISLGASVTSNELQVFVRDTGTGIAPEEQPKIFNRFYRLDRKRTSQHGVHLGLGLSICQQIVEGHKGRIWVESVLGKGSTFYFTLPVISRESVEQPEQPVSASDVAVQ